MANYKMYRYRCDQEVVVGNVEDKYESRNPIVRRLMRGFLSSFNELLEQAEPNSVHEIGCGEGHLTRHIKQRGYIVRGSDFSNTILEHARELSESHDIDFKTRSIFELSAPQDSADLVVCCEVMEHLHEPSRALEKLRSIAQPYCLISVPHEPIWRILNFLRGKYWADLGNTPGHVQHWSRRRFLALLNEFFEILEVRSPFPWIMVLCRNKKHHA